MLDELIRRAPDFGETIGFLCACLLLLVMERKARGR